MIFNQPNTRAIKCPQNAGKYEADHRYYLRKKGIGQETLYFPLDAAIEWAQI